MTPEQFCYWLQGFAEVSDAALPTERQWRVVKDHLATVFQRVTPVYVPQAGGGVAFPARPYNPLVDKAIC